MNTLYIIIFPNDKKYIGITNNLRLRKNSHKFNSTFIDSYHYKLYRAIRKYGFNNLVWKEHSRYTTREDANNAEIKMISELNTMDIKYGYNTLPGGNSGRTGIGLTQETKDKISKANKGRPMSNEQKAFLSKSRIGPNNPAFGIPTSKKQKEAVSKASSGTNNVNSKLTNIQVADIRKKYNSENCSIKKLIDEYNVTKKTIYNILKNKSYFDPNYSRVDLIKHSTLTIDQVETIKNLYSTGNFTYKMITTKFKIGSNTVFKILNNNYKL